jgi:hypothetical protein
VFPVRYEPNSYINLLRNSVFKWLNINSDFQLGNFFINSSVFVDIFGCIRTMIQKVTQYSSYDYVDKIRSCYDDQ